MKNVKTMVDNFLCTGCTKCVLFCPNGYIAVKQGDLGFPVPYIEKCDNCGACIRSCPFSDEFDEDDSV